MKPETSEYVIDPELDELLESVMDGVAEAVVDDLLKIYGDDDIETPEEIEAFLAKIENLLEGEDKIPENEYSIPKSVRRA